MDESPFSGNGADWNHGILRLSRNTWEYIMIPTDQVQKIFRGVGEKPPTSHMGRLCEGHQSHGWKVPREPVRKHLCMSSEFINRY